MAKTKRKAKAARKVLKVMREFKAGKLMSGSGRRVKSHDQAIAIALSEARKAKKKKPAKRR